MNEVYPVKYEVFQDASEVVWRLNYWKNNGVNLNAFFIQIVPKTNGTFVLFFDSNLQKICNR